MERHLEVGYFEKNENLTQLTIENSSIIIASFSCGVVSNVLITPVMNSRSIFSSLLKLHVAASHLRLNFAINLKQKLDMLSTITENTA